MLDEGAFLDAVLLLRPKPKRFNPDRHLLQSDYWVQQKLDGYRCTVIRNYDTDETPVRVVGRKRHVNLWNDLQHQSGLASAILALQPRTVLDGEYFDPDGTSTDVPTLMREGRGEFRAWAVPWHYGQPCASRTDLPRMQDTIAELGFLSVESERVGYRSYDDLLSEALGRKIEGFVLKRTHWGDDGWKVKPLHTYDLLVTGYVPGESRNRGKIGSLRVSAHVDGGWVEVGKCGGLDNVTRGFSGRRFCQLHGRVVEVQAEGLTTHGRLKFARLVRFRDDLNELGVDTWPKKK